MRLVRGYANVKIWKGSLVVLSYYRKESLSIGYLYANQPYRLTRFIVLMCICEVLYIPFGQHLKVHAGRYSSSTQSDYAFTWLP